ncbi:hypothetical protein [Neolewinella antarctica]|uniref:Uncharacterized protein n=1 Tax=Neolewinella antarctica TaxID=442734 RepID=A0ABX0X6M3_9BACT|nr:hypothetical protein [Neolewinella antarctica]NJC24879.1 hypothetical protein [Neolewinella antarctica]
MADDSIFEKKIDPVYQAGGVLILVFVFQALGTAVSAGTEDVVNNRWAWLCAASFMLFYALFNAIMSATSKNILKYWGRSLYSFMGLALGSGLLAWAFSGIPIGEAGSYKWIFFVVTFGYLVFMSMIAIMKNVVDFAQKEEWNKPKLKSRKRR